MSSLEGGAGDSTDEDEAMPGLQNVPRFCRFLARLQLLDRSRISLVETLGNMTKKIRTTPNSRAKDGSIDDDSDTPSKRIATGTVSFEEIINSWRRERPDLDLANMLVALCLSRLGRMLQAEFEQFGKDRFGITGSELRVLLALRRAGRPFARRPTDLFRALIVTSGAITKQVNRLEQKELVARTPDPLHAGGFLVHLTPAGLKVANISAEQIDKKLLVARAMKALPAENRAAGIQFVEHLIRYVERHN